MGIQKKLKIVLLLAKEESAYSHEERHMESVDSLKQGAVLVGVTGITPLLDVPHQDTQNGKALGQVEVVYSADIPVTVSCAICVTDYSAITHGFIVHLSSLCIWGSVLPVALRQCYS